MALLTSRDTAYTFDFLTQAGETDSVDDNSLFFEAPWGPSKTSFGTGFAVKVYNGGAMMVFCMEIHFCEFPKTMDTRASQMTKTRKIFFHARWNTTCQKQNTMHHSVKFLTKIEARKQRLYHKSSDWSEWKIQRPKFSRRAKMLPASYCIIK